MPVHKNIFQTSDFIIYTVILITLVLELLSPTNLQINHLLSISFGIFLLLSGWTIIFVSKYQFKKHQQKSGPNNETTQIIKTGLFGYTRNPIYLGVLLLSPAIGLLIDSAWLLFSIIPTSFLLYYFLIIPEEKYLKNKFESEYEDYCKNVRRWF